MQLHRRAQHPLQESIVQVLSDTRSLCKPFLKASVQDTSHLVHPHAVDSQCQKSDAKYQRQPKPPHLPERWLDLKPDRSFRTIPLPVTVASHDAEMVSPCSEIAIGGFPVGHCFAPPVIKSLKHVAVAHPFRVAKAQTHVAKRRPLDTGRHPDAPSQLKWSTIRRHAFNMHQSWNGINGFACGIHNREATIRGKPNHTLRVDDDRLIPLHSLRTIQSIRQAVFAHIYVAQRIGYQAIAIHLEHFARSCNPQPSILVLSNSEYWCAKGFRYCLRYMQLPIFEVGEAFSGTYPQDSAGIL